MQPESYPFVEWDDIQLLRQHEYLADHLLLPHSPDRREQIRREIAHLMFEVEQRSV